MNLLATSTWLIWILDLSSLFALLTSGEIFSEFAIPALAALGFVAFWRGIKRRSDALVKAKFVGGILLITFVAGLGASWKMGWHPLVVGAHGLLIIHPFLWLQASDVRNKAQRIAMGFANIAVSASISPDLHTAFLIFLFAILGSISLCYLFIEKSLQENNRADILKSLPLSYLIYTAMVSTVVLFLSLVIFPLLPRNPYNLGLGFARSDNTKIGYTNEIDLGISKAWGANDDRIALRIFFEEEPQGKEIIQKYFPFGLLKGHVLDKVSGSKWKAHQDARGASMGSKNKSVRPTGLPESRTVMEIVREPLGVSSLPVPYYTESLAVVGSSLNARSSFGGGWILPGSEETRMQYRLVVHASEKTEWPPLDVHHEVPSDWNFQSTEWTKIQSDLFAHAHTPIAKMRKVNEFLMSGKFIATTQRDPSQSSETAIHPQKNLEDFLFRKRKGHCELFASAASILLRLAGVPTRVVLGFRVVNEPFSGVLTVRQKEAHAWLEAWDSSSGWNVLDPTPVTFVAGESKMFDWAGQYRDVLSAYWQKYVLSFRTTAQEEVEREQHEVQEMQSFGVVKQLWNINSLRFPLISVVVVVLGSVLFWFFRKYLLKLLNGRGLKIGRNRSKKFAELSVRRKKMEKLLAKIGPVEWPKAQVDVEIILQSDVEKLAWRKWFDLHERLRFSDLPPTGAQWQQGLAELDEYWHTFSATIVARLKKLA